MILRRVGEIRASELLAAISAVVVVSFASSAGAFSVVNHDLSPHVLTIIESGHQRDVRVEPYGQASGLCSSTCEVIVDDGPDYYEVTADDALTIEDGEILADDEPFEEPTEEVTEKPI